MAQRGALSQGPRGKGTTDSRGLGLSRRPLCVEWYLDKASGRLELVPGVAARETCCQWQHFLEAGEVSELITTGYFPLSRCVGHEVGYRLFPWRWPHARRSCLYIL